MSRPCVVCGDMQTDIITLHYSADPWDGDRYEVALCRDHQLELILPVIWAVEGMRNEREVGQRRGEQEECKCQQ
ncbi:hypothetical protein [Desulfovibrio falkowii]|uniref:Uncharacterized protein n=1 Tax=Desulfovibrio falkowii TaxID=3136602 RepID=A0ABQ0EA86_9BACT